MTPSDTTIDYKVSSFQINLSCGFENKLLPNDLIIVRNHGDDEEDVGEDFGGVVDQQGQPSGVGGPIQVEFESDSESRSSPYQNQRPGSIQSPFWMLFIWMERKFQGASNGTILRPKFVRSRRESSKQVNVQNLSRCCDTIFWAVGPCIVLGSMMDVARGLCMPQPSYNQ